MMKRTRNSRLAAPLRIIVFGAHPDDCELHTGGVAAMWAARGHAVKMVNTTNGDTGHWREAGGPLAQRRSQEVLQASRVLGVTTETFDIHDGELLPTVENRQRVIRAIREWKADLVISPRPYDYHPDHRYTAVLVQDAAFLVTVPFVCPDVPALKQNPTFLFHYDRFQKPLPFKADIAISIDQVIEQKLDALAVMESQFLEGGCRGSEDLIPHSARERKSRVAAVRSQFEERFRKVADQNRSALIEWYGTAKAGEVEFAEAFEICEYGCQPSREELRRIFPF